MPDFWPVGSSRDWNLSLSALSTGYMFSRCFYRLRVFPSLSTVYMFSRPFQWFRVFLRFLPVTCFPALSTGYIFSRTFYRLHVFPRFLLFTCFAALKISYLFSRPFHRSRVFSSSFYWKEGRSDRLCYCCILIVKAVSLFF